MRLCIHMRVCINVCVAYIVYIRMHIIYLAALIFNILPAYPLYYMIMYIYIYRWALCIM